MVFYYFPIAQNKTFRDFFQGSICLYMYVHIFDYFLFTGLIPVLSSVGLYLQILTKY